MPRKAGEEFCKIHLNKWSLHGRVDGAVPEGKLREFEATLARTKRNSSSNNDAAQLQSPNKSAKSSPALVQSPNKSAKRSPALVPMPIQRSVLHSCIERLPGFGGRLAQFLWNMEDPCIPGRRRVRPDLRQLLLVGRTTRLAILVGVKDGRRFAPVGDYQRMCDVLQKVCQNAWGEARQLRTYATDDADFLFATRRLQEQTRSTPVACQGSPLRRAAIA